MQVCTETWETRHRAGPSSCFLCSRRILFSLNASDRETYFQLLSALCPAVRWASHWLCQHHSSSSRVTVPRRAPQNRPGQWKIVRGAASLVFRPRARCTCPATVRRAASRRVASSRSPAGDCGALGLDTRILRLIRSSHIFAPTTAFQAFHRFSFFEVVFCSPEQGVRCQER